MVSLHTETKTWLARQKPWIQETAKLILKNGLVSDAEVATLAAIISDGSEVSADSFLFTVATTENNILRLLAIGPVQNIDDLAPRQAVEFKAENLTLVYGPNGSGKTGYTRILKKCCGKPGAAKLKGNAFGNNPVPGTCEIRLVNNGEECAIIWNANEASIPALEAVDIFDDSSGRVYLDGEIGIVFVPPDIELLSDIVQVAKRIESHFASQISTRPSQLPAIPAIHHGTRVHNRLSNISSSSTTEEIAELVKFDHLNATELSAAQQALAIPNPNEQKTTFKNQLTQIRKIEGDFKKILEGVTQNGLVRISNQYTKKIAAKLAADESANAAQVASIFTGINSETWRTMWKAAEAFSMQNAYPDSDLQTSTFPVIEGSSPRCVFCQQELSNDSKQRLKLFHEYVTGTLAAESEKQNQSMQDMLDELPQEPDGEQVNIICSAAAFNEDETKQVLEFQQAAAAVSQSIRNKLDNINITPLSASNYPILQIIADKAVSLKAQIAALETITTSSDKNSLMSRIKELEAHKWCSEQITSIQNEFERLKIIAELHSWKRETNTAGISRKSGEISQSLITDEYTKRFNDELDALGANHLKVELLRTRTLEGLPLHRIALKGSSHGHKPGDILSEGENRVVALAAFLADTTGRTNMPPFIFDDPASSLDHRYEEHIATRLNKLSSTRQVIIFTHRLSLVSFVDGLAQNVEPIYLSREPWGAGQPGTIPIFVKRPDRALNSLKNDRLAKAKRTLNEMGTNAYASEAKSICSDLRILLERIIELELLADVIQRHRRAINTQGKIHKLAKINVQDCQFIDSQMVWLSRYEHSQSNETPLEVPLPDKIEEVIISISTWLELFKQRAA